MIRKSADRGYYKGRTMPRHSLPSPEDPPPTSSPSGFHPDACCCVLFL